MSDLCWTFHESPFRRFSDMNQPTVLHEAICQKLSRSSIVLLFTGQFNQY